MPVCRYIKANNLSAEIKLGIVGSGKIIPEALSAMQKSKGFDFKSILVRERSLDRGRELAEEYGISEIYVNANDFYSSGIDTVYVANANAFHYGSIMTAIEHGLNVIAEKPICLTSEEYCEIKKNAEKKGVIYLEACTALYNPLTDLITRLIQRAGRIKSVSGVFDQYSTRFEKYLAGENFPVFDPACGGGVMRDLGVYLLEPVFYHIGKDGVTNAGYDCITGRSGVDIFGKVTMKTKEVDNITLEFAKDRDADCFLRFDGEQGSVLIDGKPNDFKKVSFIHDGIEETASVHGRTNEDPSYYRLIYEFEFFRDFLLFGGDDKSARVNKYNEISSFTVSFTEEMLKRAGIKTKG